MVCQENQTQGCITDQNCSGTQGCVSGSWGPCTDILDDGCPAAIPIDGNNAQNTTDGGWFPGVTIPKELGTAGVMLVLLGAVALFGVLGILILTQRDKFSGLIGGIMNIIAAVRHVDQVVDRADKEYAREKVSEKFMKEGKTEEFFGLDKEDKMPPRQPEKPQKPPEQPAG